MENVILKKNGCFCFGDRKSDFYSLNTTAPTMKQTVKKDPTMAKALIPYISFVYA